MDKNTDRMISPCATDSMPSGYDFVIASSICAAVTIGRPSDRTASMIAACLVGALDGFALLTSIRLWKRPIPVICITAYATSAMSARANDGGAAGFFSKPVDDESLLALIADLLSPCEGRESRLKN